MGISPWGLLHLCQLRRVVAYLENAPVAWIGLTDTTGILHAGVNYVRLFYNVKHSEDKGIWPWGLSLLCHLRPVVAYLENTAVSEIGLTDAYFMHEVVGIGGVFWWLSSCNIPIGCQMASSPHLHKQFIFVTCSGVNFHMTRLRVHLLILCL